MPVAGFHRALIPPPLLMRYSIVEIYNIMGGMIVKENTGPLPTIGKTSLKCSLFCLISEEVY